MSFWKRLFGGGDSSPPRSVPPSPQTARQPPGSETLPEFPFPLVAVTGAKAIAEWQRYQAQWRREGASAVLLGDAEEVERTAEAMEGAIETPESFINRAQGIDVTGYFNQRREEVAADSGEEEKYPEGEWPKGRVTPMELGAHLDVLSRQPKRVVYLARIPTPRVWEIPAYLKFGGWNDCPDIERQVAVFKYWAEKHLIEIYALTGDVVECTVARPPRTKEAAQALAWEQFLFCTDIVYQGTQSIGLLAGGLLEANAWYFWWD